MRTFQKLRHMFRGAAVVSVVLFPAIAQESVAELQAKFDHENNSVKKAKLLVRLGDAQFEESRRAGKAGDNNAVDATMEKYRDNVRAALDALKKQHPDAEIEAFEHEVARPEDGDQQEPERLQVHQALSISSSAPAAPPPRPQPRLGGRALRSAA